MKQKANEKVGSEGCFVSTSWLIGTFNVLKTSLKL